MPNGTIAFQGLELAVIREDISHQTHASYIE